MGERERRRCARRRAGPAVDRYVDGREYDDPWRSPPEAASRNAFTPGPAVTGAADGGVGEADAIIMVDCVATRLSAAIAGGGGGRELLPIAAIAGGAGGSELITAPGPMAASTLDETLAPKVGGTARAGEARVRERERERERERVREYERRLRLWRPVRPRDRSYERDLDLDRVRER